MSGLGLNETPEQGFWPFMTALTTVEGNFGRTVVVLDMAVAY